MQKRAAAASKVDIVDTVFKPGKKDRDTSASNHDFASNHGSEVILDDVLYLRRMPYKEYLQTEHWQKVRQTALDHAKHRCQLCNASERLQVHHRTYERRGCEELIDLTVLCSYCHAKHHDKLRPIAK
jgi:5-methylcytosine-specific restriction endonuclease McrA